MKLVICHLYPDLMNIYGDRGNVIALAKRCLWRGIDVEVKSLGLGDKVEPGAYDIFFMGGGQDKEQVMVSHDLYETKGETIRREIEQGACALVICGGYQLFGNFYRPAEGEELPGIGVFDAYTIAGSKRFIGNVFVETCLDGRKTTVVGFENHSGKTYLGKNERPLGEIIVGYGNNGEDKTEGAVHLGAIGTYLHGSLLPKNPELADFLIRKALKRTYPGRDIEALDDSVENLAHKHAIKRAKKTH